jgi:hypothetical protein
LIFIDLRAIRVIERLPLPYYSELSHNKSRSKKSTIAIQKIMEKYHITVNQIDAALYEMGDACSAEGCNHNPKNSETNCIFHNVCEYENKIE